MKRIAALFLVMYLLCPSAMAEAFVEPVIPEFSAEYGLYELYTGLEANWGPPHLWTLEQKAWLSGSMDALLEKESARCAELGWAVNAPFTHPLKYYQHGLQDATAIDQATALTMAVEHLKSQGFTVTPEGQKYAGFYYLVDDPTHPVWRFSFVEQDGHTYTYMDAHTGAFSHHTEDDIVPLAWQHIVDAGTKVALQPLTMEHLANYTVVPHYHAANQTWIITFTNTYPAFHEFQITVSDTTLEILDMTASNG